MPFTDPEVAAANAAITCTDDQPAPGQVRQRWRAGLTACLGAAAALLAGCGGPRSGGPAPLEPPLATTAQPGAPARDGAAAPRPGATPPAGEPHVAAPLRPMARARNWDEFRLLAGQRLAQANPALTYSGPVPEPLLAIPVLEIELNADGSVRHIAVSRRPRQALDTVQLAIAAVHRAAPFGSVSHLPKPWKFTEVFLFDEDRRFKPRSLDL